MILVWDVLGEDIWAESANSSILWKKPLETSFESILHGESGGQLPVVAENLKSLKSVDSVSRGS